MNPNANLAEQRAIVAQHYAPETYPGGAVGSRLVELVDSLDAWIAGGGELPDAWKVASA